MLLAYNRNNMLGGGCQDEDIGLTAQGRRVLDEMKRVGMVLCCTHTGERTAREATEYMEQPVIFSHSNPRVSHDHPRNITDEQIRACPRSGEHTSELQSLMLLSYAIFCSKKKNGSRCQ